MSSIYSKPPTEIFNTRIDKLTNLASTRLQLLREFNKIKSIYDSNALDECQKIYIQFAGKNHETLDLNTLDNDLLSFWTLKFAFSNSQDSINWHIHVEQCFMLARQTMKNTHLNNFLTQKLTLCDPKTQNFCSSASLVNRLLVQNPQLKCTLQEDFYLLAPALHSFKFPVINRQFFISESGQSILNLAKFSQIYDKSTQNCSIIATQADSVFGDLLAKLRQNRHGQVQFMNQIDSNFNFKSIFNSISKKEVPLCMVRLIKEMQKNCHLKYQGRIQLTSFLRDAGMQMDEVILMFQTFFTAGNRMSVDKFIKEYAYNIKHIFGQVGSRKGAHCSGCEKIIDQIPGKDQYHGCPFRSMPIDGVKELIVNNYRCDIEESGKAIDQALKYKEYTAACNHLYHSFFGSGMNYVHPIQWIRSCQERGDSGDDIKE